MQPTSASPTAAILDYAAPTPRDTALRRLRASMMVLFCTLMCGGIGWLIEPRTYRALGYVQIEQTQAGTSQLLDVKTVRSRQAATTAGIAAPANLNAAAALLPVKMAPTPAEIAPKLKVQTIPSSRLVSVSFENADPNTAASVANAVMTAHTAPGISTIMIAGIPSRPQQNQLYPIGGAAAGLLLGAFIVAWRWK